MRDEAEIRAGLAEYHAAFNRIGQTGPEWCFSVGEVAVDLAGDAEDLLNENVRLRAAVDAVTKLCDQYRANCAPDSTQAQVAEMFRAALAGVEQETHSAGDCWPGHDR